MTAPLFPVASTPEAALHAPDGWAARESEAQALAGAAVELASAVVGPAFATREAAAEAYAARLAQGGDWCALRPVTPEGLRPSSPVRPLTTGDRRWPEPVSATALWRLQMRWWRPTACDADPPELAPARKARRGRAGAEVDASTLGRLAVQPLRAVRPQQPLDIGLFEVRAPEAPDRLIADE